MLASLQDEGQPRNNDKVTHKKKVYKTVNQERINSKQNINIVDK